jgi:tetratricopeptide (TPR) repeat protein
VASAYLTLGEAGRARNHFERALQYGASRLEASYGLALALWELHEDEELLRVANRIEHLAPGDRAGRYFRALARSATEEADGELVAGLQQAIRESGPDEYLMTALGRAYIDTGLARLAVGWLERTLKVAPGHGEALELLLEAREELAEPRELAPVYRRYLERFPDDDKVRRRFVGFLTGQSLWEEASRGILVLLAHQPASRALRKMLANCYLMTSHYRDAAVLYRGLLRDEPQSLALLRALVRCLDRMRSHRSAIVLLEKADPFFKGHVEVLLPLGVLYIKVKDYERAQATLRRVLAAAPRDWRAHHNLGRAYAKAGQKVFAERFFESARRYRAAGSQGGRGA